MFRTAISHIATYRGVTTILISTVSIGTLVVMMSQAPLLFGVIGVGNSSVWSFLQLLFSVLSSAPNLIPIQSFLVIIFVGVLFGINATLGHAYRARVGRGSGTVTKGLAALLASLFGVGCAACGPLLFANLIVSVTGVSLLAYLPFGGIEFAIIGIGFLLWANYTLLRALQNPLVCKII